MGFDIESAFSNNITIQKDGISTEVFDVDSAFASEIEDRKPKGGGGFGPRILRAMTRTGTIEMIRTNINLRKAINRGEVQDDFIRFGETFQEKEKRLDKSKKSVFEFIEEENEEIVKEGVFRQFDIPIQAAIVSQLISAPKATVKALAIFTGADLLFDVKEAFNEKFPNANPNLVDLAELIDIGLKVFITGGVLKADPIITTKIKSNITKTSEFLKGLKPANVEPKQIEIIRNSKNLTPEEKVGLLEKAGISEDVAEISINQNKPVKVNANKVEQLVKDPAFEKVKPELIDKPVEAPTQETPLVEQFKKSSKERTDILTKNVDAERTGKVAKREGFKESAVIRKLKEEPTSIELKAEQKVLDRLSIGKAVETPLGSGIIDSKPSFGRFRVKVNGEVKTFEFNDITVKKTTPQQAIDSLRTKAETEAKDFLKQRGVEGEFENVISDSPTKTTKTKKTEQKLPEAPKQTKISDIEQAQTKITKAAQDVNDRAVERGLTEQLEGLAEFDQINRKDQAKKANQLLKDDPALVQDIVSGKREPPSDLLRTAIFNAVEQDTLAKGDVLAIKELSQSPLATNISRSAQELGLRSEGLTDSPTSVIQAVEKTRTKDPKKKFSNKRKQKEAKTLRESIKKETPKLNEWENFIKGLEC